MGKEVADRRQKWKDLALYNAGINDRSLLLHKLDNSNPVQNSSLFYNQVLESWYTFFSISPTIINEILNEKLHYNKFITIGGKSLSKRSIFLQDTQISKIRDLVTNNRSNYRFKTIGELEVELKKSISCLQYNVLLSTILTDWKTKLLKDEETNLQGKEFQIQHLRIDVKRLSNNTIYQSLTYSKCSHTAENKWVEYYPFLETIDWSNVYILPSIITSDLRLRSFQYSIIHRYFTCNYNLHLWKIAAESLCLYCGEIDTIEHYFYYCSMASLILGHLKTIVAATL